jgi:hypothetical protein
MRSAVEEGTRSEERFGSDLRSTPLPTIVDLSDFRGAQGSTIQPEIVDEAVEREFCVVHATDDEIATVVAVPSRAVRSGAVVHVRETVLVKSNPLQIFGAVP